ncbi:hypothetical protein ACHAPJ_010610 [Fusarium lateritium]
MSPVTSDHELIRNCIARYSIAIDLGDWDLFSKVFSGTIKAHFPDPIGTFEGLPALREKIKTMVGALETQHALSTQLIELTGETTAEATTYGRAVHFGTDKNEGRSFTARGVYKDKLVKAIYDGLEDWRITERRVIYQGPPSGDFSLLAM